MDFSELDGFSLEELEDAQEHYKALLTDANTDIASDSVNMQSSDESVPKELLDILQQQRNQRDTLLNFLISLTHGIVIAFVIFLTVRIICLLIFDIDVLSDDLLKVIVVSMFAEVILTIRSITNALWDGKTVFSSPIINNLIDKHKKQ